MIRTDELMIGDWVSVEGTPRQVEAITKKKIGYYRNKQEDGRLYYARLREIEPIKLTNLILEKTFGQRETPDHFKIPIGALDIILCMHRNDYCLLMVKHGLITCGPFMDFCIKDSLHILQNALRIYNIEVDWKF